MANDWGNRGATDKFGRETGGRSAGPITSMTGY